MKSNVLLRGGAFLAAAALAERGVLFAITIEKADGGAGHAKLLHGSHERFAHDPELGGGIGGQGAGHWQRRKG